MSDINLYNGDCNDLLEQMIQNNVQVDMVLTSPPYDDIKNYNNTNAWNFEAFKRVANNLVKSLKDGGVIIW